MIKKSLITIFTPTYNRAHTLKKVFDGLQAQKSLNFNWLIIDDGSTDTTETLVNEFIKISNFKITYLKKQNEGKHVAINLMLNIIETDLVAIVDSDDYLDENAVKIIEKDYHDIRDVERICSIYYLIKGSDGKIIGEPYKFDRAIKNANLFFVNKLVKGDKFIVFITEEIKKFRFPVFKGEKFIGETALWLNLQQNRNSYFRNIAIYNCTYLDDGLSNGGRALRIKNPFGGMYNSKVYMQSGISLLLQLKNTILYIVYALFANKNLKWMIKDFPKTKLLYIMFPFGCILYKYWSKKFNE